MDELGQPGHWWWLSFADGERGFLGAVLINAPGFATALVYTRMLGINPGGEVCGQELPDGAVDADEVEYANRLLSKQDIIDKFGGAVRMVDGSSCDC